MLENDVPYAILPHWGRISLPEYLDYNRSGKGWDAPVIGWHVTTTDRLPSIRQQGLIGSTCSSQVSSGVDRPYATYFFCSRAAADNNIPLITDDTNAVIITITIPANATHKLHNDHLWNMAYDKAGMSAIQYRDDIPAEWITLP